MKPAKDKQTERGLTMVESMAAMVIFSLAIVSITPPIIFAMANRVRAHRAEQAMKLAQSEIDRVRLVLERGNGAFNNLNDFVAHLPPSGGDNIEPQQVAAPTPAGASACATPQTQGADEICLVDVNNDGENDFAIQTFRTLSQCLPNTSGDQVPVGFWMGVRVYTKASLDFSGGSLSKEQASLSFSNANTAGSSPLAVRYISIARTSIDSNSLDVYQDLAKKATGDCP
ncbi:type IV pilus modification PilV family protein [Phormidium sp. CCY1219]|uniref:type IV pilus modification PilV family protein n=1 Tax=Phormidium sp. CCY1219 TaxID=2886104 RepID=UPI002D1E95B9|nr:type II secretion system protein [Phormidium sp. CCY1219]MEB3831288.1 type II secretion system GspH family protein [Phormidium sp. CCY1219]